MESTFLFALRGGCGFKSQDYIGLLTEKGQLVIPDEDQLTRVLLLPDTYLIKTMKGVVITVDELRKSLRQGLRKHGWVAIGLECQFPTMNSGEFYSVPLPTEEELVTAALKKLLAYLHRRQSSFTLSRVVPGSFGVPRNQLHFNIDIHTQRGITKARAAVIGSPHLRPYYVTWIKLNPDSPDVCREYWLDALIGDVLKHPPTE